MKYILLIAAIIICMASCTRPETDCYDPAIHSLLFTSANNTDSINDDSAHLYKYIKDDSYTQLLYEYGSYPEKSGKAIKIVFPANVRAEAYDWEIKLYPSGKTYRLHKIDYSNDQVKQHRYKKVLQICGNKVFYSVNNKASVLDPEGPYFDASLPITY